MEKDDETVKLNLWYDLNNPVSEFNQFKSRL